MTGTNNTWTPRVGCTRFLAGGCSCCSAVFMSKEGKTLLCQHVFHTHVVQIFQSPCCSWYLNVDCHKQHGKLISVCDFIIKLKEMHFSWPLWDTNPSDIRSKWPFWENSLLGKTSPDFNSQFAVIKAWIDNKNNSDLRKEQRNTGNYIHFNQILHLNKAIIENICVIIAKHIGTV